MSISTVGTNAKDFTKEFDSCAWDTDSEARDSVAQLPTIIKKQPVCGLKTDIISLTEQNNMKKSGGKRVFTIFREQDLIFGRSHLA